jgi:Tfp pilus assembly protein PilF
MDTLAILAEALARHRAGDEPAAESLYREVLAAEPGQDGAAHLCGLLLRNQGRLAEAASLYEAALAAAPEGWRAAAGLAQAMVGLGHDGVPMARRAVAASGGATEARFALGVALRAASEPAAAEQVLREVLAVAPRHARARLALGNALADRDLRREAEEAMREAVVADPGLAEGWASLGWLLSGDGRLGEAIALCDRAIALRSDFAEAYWNRSFARLLGGDFRGGFTDYEWRRRHVRFAGEALALPGQEWRGGPLGGSRLVVGAEQGLGDTIQFARYLPVLASMGAVVTLLCPPQLMRLFAGIGVGLVAKGAPPPEYDLWVDQMSLPLLLGTGPDTIPSPAGYLRPDPALRAGWEGRLPPGPRIGIVWAGNPLHSNDARRSMPPEALLPLIRSVGAACVSLQVGPTSSQASVLGLTDNAPHLRDFAETAALVSCLDHVVAVDTSTAHLAGALGVPVSILLPYVPDWRWMHTRSDSPWYASARLWRQERPGDWAVPVRRLSRALAARWPAFGAAAAFARSTPDPLGDLSEVLIHAPDRLTGRPARFPGYAPDGAG